jgi:hypothetical protein
MAPLRALVGVLLLLVVTAAVDAEWQPYGAAAVGGERYYLDPASIKPTAVGFTVVVLSTYPVPIKESFGTFQSVKSDIEMDCGKHQLRDIDIRFHRQSMGKGRVVFEQMGSGSYQSWPAGSLIEILHEVLCQ